MADVPALFVVSQSRILSVAVGEAWKLIRPLNFKYLPNVVDSKLEGKSVADEVGGSRTVFYKDNTVQKIKLVGECFGIANLVGRKRSGFCWVYAGLSDEKKEISWDLVSSEPAVKYLGASFTIRSANVLQAYAFFFTCVSAVAAYCV